MRGLTTAEIALARKAFGDGIEYRRVRLVDGPGANLAARLAFAKGNSAITLGSTVRFRHDYRPDFGVPDTNPNGFLHEMTHVWQFQRLGVTWFLLRYAKELAAVGARPRRMYDYQPGRTRFGAAMLEAQAQMVGDYGEALWTGREPDRSALAASLAGSGLYGL